MGTPFWAALRKSPVTEKSISASIYSLPSRTTGSTLTTRSPSSAMPTSACAGTNRHRTKVSKSRNMNAYPYTYTKPDQYTIFVDSGLLGKQRVEEAVMGHHLIIGQWQQLPRSGEPDRISMASAKPGRLLLAFL